MLTPAVGPSYAGRVKKFKLIDGFGRASYDCEARSGQNRCRSGALAGLEEADQGPFFGGVVEFPGIAGEIDRPAVAILGGGAAVLVDEAFHFGRVVGVEPARGLVGGRFEADRDLVFGGDARRQDLQLELPDDDTMNFVSDADSAAIVVSADYYDIAADPAVGLSYVHLSTAPDSLLREALVYTYTRHPEDQGLYRAALSEVAATRIRRLTVNLAKRNDLFKRVKWWSEKHLEHRFEQCTVSRAQAQGVDPCADDAEKGRKEGHRDDHGTGNRGESGEAKRSKKRDLEGHEAAKPGEDHPGGEEDGTTGRGDGPSDRCLWVSTAVLRPAKEKSRSPLCSSGRGNL